MLVNLKKVFKERLKSLCNEKELNLTSRDLKVLNGIAKRLDCEREISDLNLDAYDRGSERYHDFKYELILDLKCAYEISTEGRKDRICALPSPTHQLPNMIFTSIILTLYHQLGGNMVDREFVKKYVGEYITEYKFNTFA